MNSPAFLFQAASANPLLVKLRSQRIGYCFDSYTIALGPGQVRYLNAFEFWGWSIDSLIQAIRAESTNVEVLSVPLRIAHPEFSFNCAFSSEPLDNLLDKANWENRLRIHHALGHVWIHEKMPPDAYVLFHRRLELGQHFAIAECLEAWIRSSATDAALANSYRSSLEHLFVISQSRNFAVFARTAFVRDRLEAIAGAERRRTEAAAAEVERLRTDEDSLRAAAEAELLRRSRFTTFVYIMEDRRKNFFKIGRSKTPGKRERTLQSEVPETMLRFSIPAEETHEKELHARFAHRRIRGEWFELSEDDLVEVVNFLKANGDAARVTADFQWLGTLLFHGRSIK